MAWWTRRTALALASACTCKYWSQLKLCCLSAEVTDKNWVSLNITTTCEYLPLFPLIMLALKQKETEQNKVSAGVREKCQSNVPEAPGFVLISAIMFILLYLITCTFSFHFLFLAWIVQARTSWVEHWSCMFFRHGIMFSSRNWCRAWLHSSSVLNYRACAFLHYLSSFGYLY